MGVFVPLSLFALQLSGAQVLGPVRVGPVSVTASAAGVVALTHYAERWKDQLVTIRVGPYVARYSRAALGAHLPLTEVEPVLRKLGHTGNPLRDLATLWTSRRAGLVIPWPVELTRQTLVERIRDVRNRLERPPVPGALLPNGAELPGTPGLTINLVRATEQLAGALVNVGGSGSETTEVELEAARIAAPRPVAYASGRYDPSQFTFTLVEFSTSYRMHGSAAGRARNIELAAQAIDGSILAPGGELSFNQKVGQRSYERGFEPAYELANRRVVLGVGGGVCQVAATLHAAAFLAGFGLPVYRPHSRPARYIEVGLDTMVAWPDQDMRIANVYPFPVRIRVEATTGRLSVRLEGAGKAHPVEWSKEVLQRIRPGVQRLEDESLAEGQSKVLQEAIDGLVVKRRRVVYLPSGPSVEESVLRYPPNDRIVLVSAAGEGVERTGQRVGHLARRSEDLESEDF
jgi:vancomycin resistance protein YoaR